MASRVALVHDFLLDLRGAERVFAAICEAWPDADVFTAVYDEEGTEGRFADRHPQTSFLQRVRPTSRTFRPLLPLYPHAIESFDLRGYDTVVSSSSAWAHGVLVDPGAVHVCYCHNPFRYAWTEREATLRARHPLVRPAAAAAAQPLAPVGLDRGPAGRPLRRELAPDRGARPALLRARVDRPVPAGRDRALPRRRRSATHYMVLAELMAHKRIDVAVRAFNALGLPLRRRRRRAGAAPAAADRRADRSRSPAGSATSASPSCSPRARALVVTATEEFGIAAVEALAAGRPVIALGEGGVRESVDRGRDRHVLRALRAGGARRGGAGASTRSRSIPRACRAAAERFGAERFRAELERIVAEAVRDERAPRPGGARRYRGLAGVPSGVGTARRTCCVTPRTELPKSSVSP